MASVKSRSKKRPTPSARKTARRPERARTAPAPAHPSPVLAAERRRLGLRRGEDMTLAARGAEARADAQRSRDDVHERDLSGS